MCVAVPLSMLIHAGVSAYNICAGQFLLFFFTINLRSECKKKKDFNDKKIDFFSVEQK